VPLQAQNPLLIFLFLVTSLNIMQWIFLMRTWISHGHYYLHCNALKCTDYICSYSHKALQLIQRSWIKHPTHVTRQNCGADTNKIPGHDIINCASPWCKIRISLTPIVVVYIGKIVPGGRRGGCVDVGRACGRVDRVRAVAEVSCYYN